MYWWILEWFSTSWLLWIMLQQTLAYKSLFWVLLGIHFGLEIATPIANDNSVLYSFLRTAKQFSLEAACYMLTNNVQQFPIFTHPANTTSSVSAFHRHEVVFSLWLMILNTILWSSVNLLHRKICSSLLLTFEYSCLYFYCWALVFFYIMNINLMPDMICKYSILFRELPFYISDSVLDRWKLPFW